MVKPHIKKYIDHHANFQDKFVVNSKNNVNSTLISNVIKMFICYKTKFYATNSKNLYSLDGFVPTTIYISTAFFYRFGGFISNSDHSKLNKMIDCIFRQNLYHYVGAAKIYSSTTYINAISDFLSQYDINDDDIDIDSLLRDIHRRTDV